MAISLKLFIPFLSYNYFNFILPIKDQISVEKLHTYAVNVELEENVHDKIQICKGFRVIMKN
jgi:hypothetical protein